jgi:hypothetical protein
VIWPASQNNYTPVQQRLHVTDNGEARDGFHYVETEVRCSYFVLKKCQINLFHDLHCVGDYVQADNRDKHAYEC